MPQRFSVIPGSWAIVRYAADAPVPPWALLLHDFVSITRTRDELSIVCPVEQAPVTARAELDWALLKIDGPFAFDETGILASFATPLAEAGIGLVAIATFDTDYILVKQSALAAACRTLVERGHTLTGPPTSPTRCR